MREISRPPVRPESHDVTLFSTPDSDDAEWVRTTSERLAAARADEDSRRADPVRRRARIGTGILVAGLALLLVLAFTPAPYVIRQPGPAFDALHTTTVRDDEGNEEEVPVIDIDGATSYDVTSGELTVMTVNIAGTPQYQPSWMELAIAWLSPSKDVLPIEAYYPDGVTKEDRDAQTAQLMQDSQATAIAAALGYLDYEVGTEMVVGSVASDGASAGLLQVGDVLLKYGAAPVSTRADIQAITLPTEPIDITIRRDGTEQVVSITPKLTATDEGERPLLGVSVQEQFAFPIEVDIQLGDVGGPSAGLVFALATIDKLEPGDLGGGDVVAGSGTMSADGKVGPIGGIRQKLYAANEIGADYFIASEANCREALDGGVPGGLTVYAVADLAEAVNVMKTNASEDAPNLRTCADALAANVPQA